MGPWSERNIAHGQKSTSARSLFPVAPPVNGLNVVRVIVSPSPVHAAGMDVVGHHVAVIGEPCITERAFSALGHDLPVEELPHLSVGSEFSVSPGVLRIFSAPNSHLALALFSWDLLSSAAEERAVNRALLITAESHEVLLIGLGAMVQLG